MRSNIQNQGYKISYFTDRPASYPKDEQRLVIKVRHDDYGCVAEGEFLHFITQKQIKPLSVGVSEEHRRKGIATAMYVRAEEITNSVMIRSDDASPDAEELWAQTNRPFGAGKD